MSGRETVVSYGSTGVQMASCELNKENKKRCWSCGRYEGIMFTILAGIAAVVWSSLAKYMKDFNPIELTFSMTALSGSFTLPVVVHQQRTWPTITRSVVFGWILVGSLMTTASTLRIWSFKLLPLGDASSIVFSTPVFTAIFARIILKDRITWMTIISLVLSVVGMLLTMRIPDLIISGDLTRRLNSQSHLIGCICAVGAVVATAGTYLAMRTLRGVPLYLNSFVQLFLNVIICGLALPAFGGFHQPSCTLVTSVCVIAIGLNAFLFNLMINQALKTEDATTMGTVLRTTEVFLAFLIQLVIFHDGLDVYNSSGAIVVLTSGLLMPLQRWMEGKPQGSTWKESRLIK